MVQAIRSGESQRAVASRFGVDRNFIRFWLARAGDKELELVDWRSKKPGRAHNKTSDNLAEQIRKIRLILKEKSSLGEYRAELIQEELFRRGVTNPPHPRTIERILGRIGCLDKPNRIRRPPPPTGWYLPQLCAAKSELDSFDTVEGLCLADGPFVEVFNGISVHSSLVFSEPVTEAVKTDNVLRFLLAHWRTNGLPAYAQFDNAPIFIGSPKARSISSRVALLCLSLGVTPVYAPPYEFGFQSQIEAYNGQWQEKVWNRFRHADLNDLRRHSRQYVQARNIRAKKRILEAPSRSTFPKSFVQSSQRETKGTVIFLRRLTDQGQVILLNKTFSVSLAWANRLCRCEYDTKQGLFSFYQLRRKAPGHQPLLAKREYVPPGT